MSTSVRRAFNQDVTGPYIQALKKKGVDLYKNKLIDNVQFLNYLEEHARLKISPERTAEEVVRTLSQRQRSINPWFNTMHKNRASRRQTSYGRIMTASQQVDQVSDGLTRMVQSRVLAAREIKPLLVRLDRVANTLDQNENRRKAAVDWIDIENAADDFIRTGKDPEEITVEDVARIMGIQRYDEAKEVLPVVLEKVKKKLGEGNPRDRDPQPNQMLGNRNGVLSSKKKFKQL
jgi:hypothetical protein